MNRVYLVIPCLLLIILGCSPAGQSDGTTESSPLAGVPAETGLLEEAASPKPGGNGRFYPLAIGNIWHYSRVFSIDGETVSASQIERELVGHEELFDRNYVVEESRESTTGFGGSRTITSWVRYRQDRAGLYEADIATDQPPAATAGRPAPRNGGSDITLASGQSYVDRLVSKIAPGHHLAAYRAALIRNLELHQMVRDMTSSASFTAATAPPPGGPKTDEITRLRYPLRPGRSWTIREFPFYGSTVERRDIIDLPAGRRAAWRIRIDSVFLGPEDEVYLWFSRCGRLALYSRFVGTAVDENGEVIGTFVTEDNEVLEGLAIQGRSSCDR